MTKRFLVGYIQTPLILYGKDWLNAGPLVGQDWAEPMTLSQAQRALSRLDPGIKAKKAIFEVLEVAESRERHL